MAKQTYLGGMPQPQAPKFQVPRPDPKFSPMEHLANTLDSLMQFAQAGGQLTMAPDSHPTISPAAAGIANHILNLTDQFKQGVAGLGNALRPGQDPMTDLYGPRPK